MYAIKVKSSFDAAHFLAGYDGKCKNIHGHRFEVTAQLRAEELIADGAQRGMVVDFSKLKRDLRQLTDYFDHKLIYEADTLGADTLKALQSEGFELIKMGCRPTAENLAWEFFHRLLVRGYPVISVTVSETPDNIAVYSEDSGAPHAQHGDACSCDCCKS